MITSSAGSQTADLCVELQPKALTFALLSGLATPAVVILAIIAAIYGGMKVQQFRQQRAQETARSYDLDLPAYPGGDD